MCRKRSHYRREQMKRFQDLSSQARHVALLSVETVPQRPELTTKFV